MKIVYILYFSFFDYILCLILYFKNVCLYFLSENYKPSEVLVPKSVLLDQVRFSEVIFYVNLKLFNSFFIIFIMVIVYCDHNTFALSLSGVIDAQSCIQSLRLNFGKATFSRSKAYHFAIK